jgi:CO/xanthine dehydrogenase FAD-binding subunit
MKPFEYQAPTSISEAVALPADKGERARPLAGGTDLLVQLRRGLFELDLLVDFPAPTPNSGARYLRFTPRREMDIAVAGAGAWVVLSEDHARITDARIALAAVAPTPLHVAAAGAVLIGKAPAEEVFAEAARLAQEAARPIADARGTAAQRRHLVGVLVNRALRGAVQRAKGDHLESDEGGSIHG